MQTILGSGGVIGKHLARELHQMGIPVRLVSRHPQKINATDELFPADLLDTQKVADAVSGSEVVYLTAGLVYKTSVWKTQWPVIMRNVVDACKHHRSKLVFFDNVYAYGTAEGWMHEESPLNPSSEKGKVRADLANMIFSEVQKGNLTAMIVRSADFYGPDTPLSFVNAMVFDNLIKNRRPQWLISGDFKHSLTFTPDAGKATALLGNTADAYGQVWHAPTAGNPLTGKEFMRLSSQQFQVEKEPQMVAKWMIRMLGVFLPVLRESVEMLYQYDRDYLFNSTKFTQRFPDFKITSYSDGIAESLEAYLQKIEVERQSKTP